LDVNRPSRLTSIKLSDSTKNEAVIEQINAVRPNILIVGFGMPLQERWLMEN